MEKATQFIQKQKEKFLEGVGINPRIRPDTRLEAIRAKLQKLEAIVDVLRKNFVRHAKCVREMTESAYLIAQDVQQFYQKDDNRVEIVEQFTDSHLSIESVSRELYHSQFNEVGGILQMFDDWLDRMAICKHDLASAEQTRKEALILGAKVKSLREERKKSQLKGGASRWPAIGSKTPENAAEAEQMIQSMTQDYERLVQKFRDDRKELETNVQALVQKRFQTFDECLFRLMECQVDFYRSGAAFSESFSTHIAKYRETCPRGPRNSSGNNGRRQPPPPSSTPPANRRKSPISDHVAGQENVPHDYISEEDHEHEEDHDEEHSDHEEEHSDHEEGHSDHEEGHSDYEEEETEEEVKVDDILPPRQKRLHSVEDLIDIGDFHAAATAPSSNGADQHSFGDINLMDSHTGHDDLNPVHEIPPAQHNTFHDPIGDIFGKRSPGSRHSVDIGDLKRSNGGFGSPRPYQPSTYPSKRRPPQPEKAKPRNEFDPVFENEPTPKNERNRKGKHEYETGDFLFAETTLSSNHMSTTKKVPPKSAPSPSQPVEIKNVHQHRREKRAKLDREIKEKQDEAIRVKRENERAQQILHDQIQQHSSDLQYKLDMWEFKNGVRRNLRTLLSSIHTVLWENSGWKPLGLTNLTRPKDVKRHYYNALLVIHPDKVKQSDSKTQATAERLFQAMNTAWSEFQEK